MTFIGIESRGSISANLLMNCLLIVLGCAAIFTEHLSGFDSSTCQFPMLILVVCNTLMMFTYLGANLWLIFKHRTHPRTRRKIRPIITGIRLFSLIWNIVLFALIINFIYVQFGPETCHGNARLSYFYLFIMLFITGMEVIMVFLFLCAFGCFISCIFCLMGMGADQEELSKENESGLPYLNQTKIETFRNLLGVGEEKDLECPICKITYVDEAKLRQLPCYHYFHQGCIDIWLQDHDTCPICRQKIKESQSLHSTDLVSGSASAIGGPEEVISDDIPWFF